MLTLHLVPFPTFWENKNKKKKKLDWQPEDSEAQNGAAATEHLWEESWDDDDTSDDFSNQLR